MDNEEEKPKEDSESSSKEATQLASEPPIAHPSPEQLERLKHLEELRNLDQLKKLGDLKRLEELRELVRLESLEKLERLTELQSLRELDHLKNLAQLDKTLNDHQQTLKPLEYLDRLVMLTKLDELEKLMLLQQLDKLDGLESLESIKELERLSSLSELAHLQKIDNLRELNKLDALENLKTLSQLSQLQKLNDLSKLDNLKQLDKLQNLDRLDKIEDAKFTDRLEKLDRIDILNQKTRGIVVNQGIGLIFEISKFVIAGFLIVFLLTRETGREIVTKILPTIGFGHAAQVNLGLKLLIGETSPDQFKSVISDVRSRIKTETDAAYSLQSILPLRRRVEMMDQILAYSFTSPGVDLRRETEKDLKARLKGLETETLSRLEFEAELAHGKNHAKLETQLQDYRNLLTSKKYAQLLQTALPYWDQSEVINMAIIVGTLNLKLADSGTLDEIMRAQTIGNTGKSKR